MSEELMIDLGTKVPETWHVSPRGKDRWSGRRGEAGGRGEGPFATLERALEAVREHRSGTEGGSAHPARIVLEDGFHFLDQPVVLGPEDSGWGVPSTKFHLERDQPLRIEAAPGARPVLSGGRRIRGWRRTRFNGVEAWVAHLPEVKSGEWSFTQLWVNGRRASRTRWPQRGEFRIAGVPADDGGPGTLAFRFADGNLRNWQNLQDVEFVGAVCWTEVRLPLARVDEASRTAWLSQRSHRSLNGCPYWIENIRERFGRPGEWYLDRPAGRLYYCPRKGEAPDNVTVIAPRLGELMRLDGEPQDGHWVEQIVLRGLTFAHTEWQPATEGERADGAQSAAHLPGAIRLRGARRVRFEGCTVEAVGTHAIELTNGCRDVTISRCRLHDLGAGGIKSWHECQRLNVEDCEICDAGLRHHRSCGILIGKSSGNRIVRNHIHHLDYTGVSVGWTWGYAEGDCGGNVIESNHIHHIGRGVLSDMGAIYTLGVQPGTRIRFNHLHDVTHRNYGSYGIYLDEGSSSILVEGNLIYRIRASSLFVHWGADNLLRGNFFCGGTESVVARADTEPHDAMVVEGNVIAGRGVPMHGGDWSELSGTMDRNLYWDWAGGPVRIGPLTLAEWQSRGMDRHSLEANPRFRDAASDDYRLRPGSPAHRLGIRFPEEALAAGPDPSPVRTRPRSSGILTQFLVSPLLTGAGRLEKILHPPEPGELPFTVREFFRGFASLHNEFSARAAEDPGVWYSCSIRTDCRMNLDLSLGYDGPVKLWIDRRLLFTDPQGTNPHWTGKQIIPVRVPAGEHRVMIAFGSNQGRAHGISLNFVQRPPVRRGDRSSFPSCGTTGVTRT